MCSDSSLVTMFNVYTFMEVWGLLPKFTKKGYESVHQNEWLYVQGRGSGEN